MNDDDRDLRERFAALRREQEARVPEISISSLSARASNRRRFSGRLAVATVCLATMSVAIAWLLPGTRMGHPRWNRGRERAGASFLMASDSIASWKPATDFLLDTPGRELLRDVPAIGDWDGLAGAEDSGAKKRQFKNQVLN